MVLKNACFHSVKVPRSDYEHGICEDYKQQNVNGYFVFSYFFHGLDTP